MMEPMILGRLLQAIDLKPTYSALEIGTATGYGAAVLARIVRHVVALESDPGLAKRARTALAELETRSCQRRGRATRSGIPQRAPYNIIPVWRRGCRDTAGNRRSAQHSRVHPCRHPPRGRCCRARGFAGARQWRHRPTHSVRCRDAAIAGLLTRRCFFALGYHDDQPASISPAEVDTWRKSGKQITLLDVREPWEVELCQIEGAAAVPLGQVTQRVDELPKDRPLVVFCHHGMRSMQAVMWLRRNGVPDAINLEGGIDAWARAIDPSVGVY